MNTLVSKVNEKLKSKPLIYFTRDVERAIGLETVLDNYHICCIEDSYIVDRLIEEGFSVFCLEKIVGEVDKYSTHSLLNYKETQDWIQDLTNNSGFFAMTFFPSQTFNFKVEKLGGEVIGNKENFYDFFEDKIKVTEFFNTAEVQYPKSIIKNISESSYEELINELGETFIVQQRKSHTGNETDIIKSKEDFENYKKLTEGNTVKFAQFLDGPTFTTNVCVTKNRNYFGAVQIQIQNIPELSTSFGTTLGNEFDWRSTVDNNEDFINKLINFLQKIATSLRDKNYIGLFGVDFMFSKDNIFILEINARQTANIPFQTQLELKQTSNAPLALINIAACLGIEIGNVTFEDFINLNGSQIFLRSNNEIQIKNHVHSGVYKLQGDVSAFENLEDNEFRHKVILVDEEGDKPLVFQKEGYRLDNVESGGFILITTNLNKTRKETDEIARMQFNHSIYKKCILTPWVKEAMSSIKKQLLMH